MVREFGDVIIDVDDPLCNDTRLLTYGYRLQDNRNISMAVRMWYQIFKLW